MALALFKTVKQWKFVFDLDSVCDDLDVDVSDLEPTAVSTLYDDDRH